MKNALAAVILAACTTSPAPLPIENAPTTPVAFSELSIPGQPQVIAAGGTQIVTIPDPLAIGWSGTASDGFAVEPFADIWPAARQQTYFVRALGDGTGTFAIQTNHGVAGGAVASAEVARVELVPACPDVTVALYDAAGRRLIDGSLDVAGATKIGWDTFAPKGAVMHVTADSFAPVDLSYACATQHE